MQTITIASAFRWRNKLKEKIKKLTTQMSRADTVKDVGTAEHTAPFDGKTFSETITTVDHLMVVLRDLNIAIDKANSINREDLITLETTKAAIALYEDITDQCRRAEKVRYEYNAAGGRDKIALEPILDQKALVDQLDRLKQTKDAIEEKLADSNGKIPVDFDLQTLKDLFLKA
ncbi:MAG: hypothetical protein LBQ30_08455 [Treponema sp.]|jgi:hypothetical protein|nr:hypothetical protein [Treponema sp.]